MKKLFIFLLLGIFLISFASAEFLGTFKQGSSIDLAKICDNCTFMNLTKVYSEKAGTLLLGQYSMTKNGTNYNITFTNTNELGGYSYSTCGDLNGVLTCNTDNFEITPQGWTTTSTFYFIFLIIIALVFTLGVTLKNNYIMFFGSFLVLLLGFFVIFNGVDVIKNTETTRALGIILWGLGIIGIYLSVEGWLNESGWSGA